MKTSRLLLLAVLLLAPFLARAQYDFVTNSDGGITLTFYNGPGGDVVIPAATNGLPVTGVRAGAFYGNGSYYNYWGNAIITAAIPASVTNIEDTAFGDNAQLT